MDLKQLLFGSLPEQARTAQYTKSTQSWLPVASVEDGMVITKDGRFLKILEILPVNFRLKSVMEQQNMIYYYAAYLKIAPDNLQILSVTQQADMGAYTERMRGRMEEEFSEGCRQLIEDNINEVNYLAANEAVTHRFFLVFQYETAMKSRANTLRGIAERLREEEQTARRYLDMCGLEAIHPDYTDNFLLGLLYRLTNPQASIHMGLHLNVFESVSQVCGVKDAELEERLKEETYYASPEPLLQTDETMEADSNESEDLQEPAGYTEETPEEQAVPHKKKRLKKKRIKGNRKPLFRKKDKPPELTPMEAGGFTVPDILAPSSASFRSSDQVVVDHSHFATLYITGYGYPSVVDSGWLSLLVEAGEGVNVSFTLRRQPKDKILAKIAKTTMVNRSRMRDVEDTRQDFEELDGAIASGLFLKNEMNRNGEDFYYMNTLIEVSAGSGEELEQRIAAVQTLCTSAGFQARRADYKHKEGFISTLPLLSVDSDLDRKSRRNILTRDAAAAFPFSSYEICDQSGIMLGINLHNRSVCMLDIFDSSKYESANMSIVGMTGAGKSFLLQLIALRLRQQGVLVIIIVPEKGYEFRPACEATGGVFIKLSPGSPDCINWMEIRKRSLDANAKIKNLTQRDDSLLADQIEFLHLQFSLRLPDLSNEDRALLDTAFVECYQRFGITFDNASLLAEDGVSYRPMPDYRDLHSLFLEK